MLERAIRQATDARQLELYGSGRTDAGVHALMQVAHLEVSTTLPPESLRRRINDELPADINVLDVQPVSPRFHARHSRGGLAIDEVGRFLRQTSGTPARLTAPASGLFLERVYYEGDRRDTPMRPPISID